MDSQAFQYLITEENGMRITLEFPCNSQDDSIIPEVKSILERMLHEYFENSSKSQHHISERRKSHG